MIIHEAKKPRIAQVTALNFIEPEYILELNYDSKTRGCITPQHTQKLFDRLNVIPCKKIVNWHSFHKICMDLPPHTEQQYYVHYCHKFVVIVCKSHHVVVYVKILRILTFQSIQNISLIHPSLNILK